MLLYFIISGTEESLRMLNPLNGDKAFEDYAQYNSANSGNSKL